jgi:phosphoglucomutase
METALVLAGSGIRAYLFKTLHSVPQLSFTIRYLGCIAGVVITASHNPAQYNGYKLYWEHGGQIGPVQADEITEYIRIAGYFDSKRMDKEAAQDMGLLVMLGEEIDEAYYRAAGSLALCPDLLKEKGGSLRLVYTPLHGTGNVPVRRLLKEAGLTNVEVVPEQELPDPAFPTVSAPNPENKEAFSLAFSLADKTGADTVLATDPDSDRLGVAVRGPGGAFSVLTGNQIGCLLTAYILEQKDRMGTLPSNAVVVRSIVTSRMADAICDSFGAKLLEVLTGFRYISEIIAECEKTGRYNYLFGFEESYGFLAGTFARDKDAISASLLVAEAALYYGQRNMTLLDAIDELYHKYGYFREGSKSYSLDGKEGLEKIRGAMSRLRSDPPMSFAGTETVGVDDYLSRIHTSYPDHRREPVILPSTDALMFTLSDGSWICVRPSGTEPKLKLYAGTKGKTAAEAEKLLGSLLESADGCVSRLLV